MNLFKKKSSLSNFFGLDDSHDDNFEFENEESFEKEMAQYASEPSGAFETSEEKITPSSDLSSSNQYTNKKVVAMNSYQGGTERNRQVENKRVHRKITVFEPRAYADCKSIAQALFRKEIVIVTFSAMEEHQARRVVDFVTGTIYAVDGDIQRIGEEIFICTPANVDVDSTVAQSLVSTHLTNY
ncbi:cell division protein SepF [Vagococcus carniphilus]|uniref:Cell division protein SepF n=1 Tax=Vagococcus carniphilus TaxID=218144 RepID=A0AAW8U5B4_9ENTE|nr:cell division protein SepF [Vagococcus carniphilus]MDT2813855.1 cell division protein SepF [Vagococcus carniphilus]MDT2829858.1 cell division protein SepF [Vagococcus carniphilus]MDT2834845.1 cell division protein SepF [Vagococcus carniphilus]MDT2838292.1 cell division protein SepF [Vagococcus carniphilus]MDT2850025.1 cell division protein SepF [Vagococcus carniphilus]